MAPWRRGLPRSTCPRWAVSSAVRSKVPSLSRHSTVGQWRGRRSRRAVLPPGSCYIISSAALSVRMSSLDQLPADRMHPISGSSTRSRERTRENDRTTERERTRENERTRGRENEITRAREARSRERKHERDSRWCTSHRTYCAFAVSALTTLSGNFSTLHFFLFHCVGQDHT